MQHIAHLFIGDKLVSFRDKFASIFRRLHSNLEMSLFAAISLTVDENGRYILAPDENGDSLDGAIIDNDSKQSLVYFFEDMYRRKVTVAHPGNQSMVVVIWAKLFLDDNFAIIKELTDAIIRCDSNIHVEVAGFTHDTVSCFITNPSERLSPDIYKARFDNNIDRLRQIRSSFASLRLIANRNMDNVSLGLNEEAMVRIIAEYAAIMCEHYISIHPTVIDSEKYPFETFGVSSILFDLDYYKTYIKNRIIIDKMLEQDIEKRSYNINALAQRTNPVLKVVFDEIHDFYNEQVTDAKALLALNGNATVSNVVGTIDEKVKGIIERFSDKIQLLLSSGQITIFESEALLSLILGDDCHMFDSSAVDAEEVTIDDIIDESANFFITHDIDKSRLKEISQKDIKNIRKCMRNIAVANRQREERLNALDIQIKEDDSIQRHIDGNGYRFGGTDYKVDLNIDKEPLELIYEPHDVKAESVDLRDVFAPIRNQGKQGSCASFAVSSVIEALRHDSKRYSPAFLYWTAREVNGATNIDSGASLYNVIKGASQKGACTEERMPYNPEDFSLAPSEVAIIEALDCIVVEAKTVEPKVKDIKSALSDGYPVIIVSKIFDSFSDTRSGFVRHPSSKELSVGGRSDCHGNHAMVVCGFSDKERVFVVRNSWGTDFGDNGYCYIPYSYAQQYFLQACIISKLSSSESKVENNKTIRFNMSDSNIEAAILQNLINEDNYELHTLAEESVKLRTDWAHNVAVLGNVNNQTDIVKNSQDLIEVEIANENGIISQLQSSKNDKLNEFKRSHICGSIFSGLFCVIAWLIVYFFPINTLSWIITGVVHIVFICLFGSFRYKWRRFRQDLRDEIQNHANRINSLHETKVSLGIKAHIYGTVLRKTEQYRLDLLHKYQILKNFNRSWLGIYNRIQQKQQEMTPIVPYPFLGVLQNDLLDRYYSIWRHRMIESIDLKSIFAEFSQEQDLCLMIKNNEVLNSAVIRGLRNFSMKEYISTQNNERWQFLPDATKISEVIPDLDSRAKPFCPCNNHGDNTIEKYIFINGVTQHEMSGILPYFSQAPMPISNADPYSISVLNIVRYNII